MYYPVDRTQVWRDLFVGPLVEHQVPVGGPVDAPQRRTPSARGDRGMGVEDDEFEAVLVAAERVVAGSPVAEVGAGAEHGRVRLGPRARVEQVGAAGRLDRADG